MSMESPSSSRKLQVALLFASERRAQADLSPRTFAERTSERAPELRSLFDDAMMGLLAHIADLPAEEVEQAARDYLAQEAGTLALDDEEEDGTARASNSAAEEATEALPAAPRPVPNEREKLIDRRYRILRVLGEGGFGKVLLVEDTLQKGQKLALKLLKTPKGAPEEILARFRNEIVVLRALTHPGIPQIFNDGLTETGEFYFTMAYVEGDTLTAVIRRDAPLAPERIVRITKQILDVLDYAHKKGAVHRDLKPANVFVIDAGTPKEQIKVLDFGIAKLLSNEGLLEHAMTMNTEGGIGTPPYMAPEQMRNQAVDARTDIYALGIMIYQMCSGRMPFQGTTALELLAAKLERPPTPLEAGQAPQWLSALVMKMLERERDKRPDTAMIRVALERLEAQQKKLSSRVGVIAAALVVIGSAFAAYAWKTRPKEPTPVVARANFEVSAPAEVFEGQAFFLDFDLALPNTPDTAQHRWTLDFAALEAVDGLTPLASPAPNGMRSVLDLAVERSEAMPFEENGSVVFEGAELRRWSARRRYVASRVGELALGECFARESNAKFESKSRLVRLRVLPLPSLGKPAGFGGAIGNFQMAERVFPSTVQIGTSSLVTVTITGEGNFERFLAPDVSLHREWADLAPVKTTDESEWNRRVVAYSILPKGSGATSLPPLGLDYFDPRTKTYERALTRNIEFVTTDNAPPEAPTDTDGDGTPDASDACPRDPEKTAPGQCGCGHPDTDSDGDGSPDCIDGCPNDPNKQTPGVCGCGVADVDLNGNGVVDCREPLRPTTDGGASSGDGSNPSTNTPVQTNVTPVNSLQLPRGFAAGAGTPNAEGWPETILHTDTGIELVRISGTSNTARYIAVHEMSWDRFDAGGGAQLTKPRFLEGVGDAGTHPVINVSFDEALDFCRRNGFELPRVSDFRAAGRRANESNKYPWGDAWSADACNWREGDFANTAPCGRFATDRSPLGVFDLAGNVREMVLEDNGTARGLRGGSYESKPEHCELDYVPTLPSGFTRNATTGFRVALEVSR